MNVQNDIVERFSKDGAALEPIGRALRDARAAGITVLFVRVAFRDGYPEASPRNKAFSGISQRGGMTASATEIDRRVARMPGEITVVKRPASAFTGSDLEVVLRSKGIDTLVSAGIATSGVVLSTVREAADRDYRLTVLHHACIEADPEVHRVLVEKVFPRQADVVSVSEWARALSS